MTLTREPVGEIIDGAAIQALQSRLRGEVIRPGDARYDSARQVQNASIDRYPGLIVRCADEADVIRAVHFARDRDLSLAVRSGGHSIAGHGTVDGGLVVDLSKMRGLSLDLTRRVAWAQTGLRAGDYTSQAHMHGLATPFGDTSSVGLGGLTLGGGIGFLVRKHGLTIDNLISVDVVTADGRFLVASADENPDLFWALRGGGGNFGIATAFQYKLQDVGTIMGGALFLPATEEVLRGYADYAAQAPDELTTITFITQAPPLPFIPTDQHGKLVFIILACYVGNLEEGQRVVAPLRSLGQPIADVLGPMPYPTLYNFTEPGTVRQPACVRSGYLPTLSDDAIETILDQARNATVPHNMIQLRALGGAMARVPADDTAFAHRDKQFILAILTEWQEAADTETSRAWTKQCWDAIRPYTSGVYANFLDDEGEERIHEAYPPRTYARLAAIKRRYDPTNVFHLNQNIHPAG